MSSPPKPPRTFGISLAIFFSVLLFTVWPLLQFVFFAVLSNRITFTDDGGMSGLSLGGTSDGQLFLQVIMALIFLLISIFAWLGRPKYIRQIFSLSVVGLAVLAFIMTIMPALNPPGVEAGFNSTDAALQQLRQGQFVMSLVVTVYVVWYMNRWPARAFYRGAYLPDEIEILELDSETGGPSDSQ